MVLFAVFQDFTADQENEFYRVPLYPPEKIWPTLKREPQNIEQGISNVEV
jgi:hypothetical protein